MADVQPLIWGYKFTREIARRMPHFRGEPPILHPAFAPGGSASVLALAEGPVPMDAPRIVYSEEDERALEEFARAQGMSLLAFSVSLPVLLFTHMSTIRLCRGCSGLCCSFGELFPLQCTERPSLITCITCTDAITFMVVH
jgi:hypothetical protein